MFIGDILVLNGFFIALNLKGHFIIATWNTSWLAFLAILNIAWIIISFYANPYRLTRVKTTWDLLLETMYATFQHFLVTCTAIYLFGFELVHKWGPLAVYAGILSLMIIWRIAFLYFLKKIRLKGYNYRKVIIVGYGNVAKELESFFKGHPDLGYKFLGFFDDTTSGEKIMPISTLESFIKHNPVDEIYCCLPYIKYGVTKRVIDFGEDNLIKIKLITDFRAFSSKSITLERYEQIPVLNISSIPLDDRRNQIVKRMFDILFSLGVIILILSWLYPILALIIKLDSKGPVFFKQKRTGRNNSDFICLKFRTMVVNNESDVKQAVKGDSRLTKIGAFLRRTSLDELPQFFNVLNGTMSVVGPRPHMLKHTEEYSAVIGKFMSRHFVKPGITGLAQARGFRGETKTIQDMKNRVKLDRFYIENWSFILDIRIIIQTITSLLTKAEKAY